MKGARRVTLGEDSAGGPAEVPSDPENDDPSLGPGGLPSAAGG